MSEYVQSRIEGTLKELKTYQTHDIFTQTELHEIIARRKSYEYKLYRTEKILLDYIHYIAYEQKLEKIVRKRTKSKRFNFITQRIMHLFTRALDKFDDEKLLTMFITYGTKRKEYDFMREFFIKRVMKNVKNYDLFIFAASVSLEFGDFENARKFLFKGLRFNKKEKILYRELFRLEMKYIEKCRDINESAGIESKDEIEKGSILLTVIKEFVDVFGKCQEIEEFIEMAKKYEDIENEVKNLIETMD